MKTSDSKSNDKIGKTVGRPRRKRHSEAMAKPEVRSAAASLKADWNRLNLTERGMRLQDLLRAGCSTRGLENELGISDTTIRRNLRIAELPLDAAIIMHQTGSAKKALASHKRTELLHKAAEARQTRLEAEERTGQVSDFVAVAVFEFCRQNNIFAVELENMLSWVRLQAVLIPKGSWPKVSPKRRLKLEELFVLLRPPGDPGEFWFEFCAQWLARIIRALAPEDSIRSRAFEKIERGAKAALAPPEMTPEEMFLARQKRLAYVSAPPPRRKY